MESTLKAGATIGRNVIDSLQLDRLGERMKAARMEMPEIKMPTPNLGMDVDIDVQ